MPPEAEVQQISTIMWLLKAGGFPFLLLGLIVAAIGLFLAWRRTSRMTCILFAGISILPGLLTLLAIYAAFKQFGELAASPEVPKPSDLARVISYGTSAGFFGILGTMVSMTSAIAAFARSRDVETPLHDSTA